ncbi:hypothetical protein ACFPRL_33320 [Pseudoclavibacter helvolus]
MELREARHPVVELHFWSVVRWPAPMPSMDEPRGGRASGWSSTSRRTGPAWLRLRRSPRPP